MSRAQSTISSVEKSWCIHTCTKVRLGLSLERMTTFDYYMPIDYVLKKLYSLSLKVSFPTYLNNKPEDFKHYILPIPFPFVVTLRFR